MTSEASSSPWRLEWHEGLSTYIPEIDAEHQHFIILVNVLNRAIVGRMGVVEIKKRMQAILDDAVAHFAHEEALFKEWGYPAAEEHANKHAQILLAMRAIMGRFERGGVEYEWVDAGLQVKDTLIEHLLAEDMKYRDFCCASGIEGCTGAGEPGQPS